jgi:hypothetical protein
MQRRMASLPPENHYTETVLSTNPQGQPVVDSICGRCVLYEYSNKVIDIHMCISCRFFEGDIDSGICTNEKNNRLFLTEE